MKSFILHLVVLFLFGIQQNVNSSSLKATTESVTKPLSLSISKPIETTTVILTLSSQEQNNLPKTITTTSSISSKSSKITETFNSNNRQKLRKARDLPIKNLKSSQSSISSSSSSSNSNNNNNNNNGNNGITCITLLKDGNKNVDCRELKQKEDEEQKQQQILKQEEQLQSLHQASQSLWHETQQSNRVRRTSKTPRTIQRLIAGHLTLTNDQAFSTRKIEPVTTDITKIVPVSSTTKNEPIIESQSRPTIFVGSTIRKPYRSRTFNNSLRRRRPISTTTSTFKPSIKLENYDEKNEKDDDEAFLEDPKESDNWDNGILRLSAGGGKEDNIKTKKKLDPNKTLSEQVKDGKYGLIEEELFKKRPKRPGILSYLQNKEFPHDNEKTLGGLNEEDIWLAEDHLLVIKGGGLNDNDKNEPWAPIDDYIEPDRPIKIPENPQVPPPFPIQLGPNEPIQFVGDNQITFGNSPFFNESSRDTLSIYPTGNENKNQIENENSDKENIPTGKGPYQGTTKLESITNTNKEEGYFYPRGNPAWNIKNGTLFNPFLNFRPFDFPAVPPNGSVDEFIDQFDEDDPSLYYPPPYSFIYKSNYTNPVPAGPLVPGIVLPPPPNAFSRLEKGTTTRKPRPNRPSFRQKLTRVQEYKPKTIVVTPNPIRSTTPTTRYTSIKSTTPSTTTTTTNLPNTELDLNKEVIYSQPPSYGKVRYYTPSSKAYTTPTTLSTPSEPAPVQEIISFVPQMEIKPTKDDSLSLKTPIYYEYYDTKPTPAPTPEVYYKEILPPTVPPSPTIPLQHTTSPLPQAVSQTYSSKPVTSTYPTPAPKQHSTRKHKPSKITTIKPVLRKPNKQYSSQGKTYLTQRPYNFDDYINIKPQPEIRPNGIAQYDTPVETIKPIYNPKSEPDFDREINSIRQTLQFFNGQQPNYDYHQSTHKPKPIYEYSFDVTGTNPSTPKPQFDTEPFQPMVKYSSPVDDVNGFRAITYPDGNDQNYYNTVTGNSQVSQKNQNDQIRVQIIYDSTPRPENGFYSNAPPATHSTLIQAQNPWISIEKQVVHEIGTNGLPITTRRPPKRRPSSRKIEQVPKTKFDGYFYNPPQTASSQVQRTNNRYYEEPFSKHLSEIRKKLNPTQPQSQPLVQWNIENATNFDYVTPRPIFNQPNDQMEQYLRERTFEGNSNPGNTYLWNIENYTNAAGQQYKTINSNSDNIPQQNWQQQQQQPHQQPSQLWSLESDINVNNIPYGRPPSNPDSEFIELYRPQSTHHKSHRDKYRDGSKSIKPNAEPFMQYLREVTPNENLTPQSQKLWGLDSNLNEPYARPSINRNVEIIEQQPIRPSHHYKQQQQQQQPQRINGAESFKQYLHKITPNKNYNPHTQQVWRLENDTNVNRIPQGRPPINSNSEFIPPQQRRPIYRENIREFAPSQKLQRQQQQQVQPQQQQQQLQQQQQSCKWPRNCNTNQNGQQNIGVSSGHSLHSDTNINYGQKLPPINPNSEFINPYQPFLNEYNQQPQHLVPKPIYNRPQPLIDNTNSNYQQESYQNMNNNQRQQQRSPK